jgi:hypothetical protein
MSKTLSVGRVLAVIKCIYLPPTYLHFMQDIEDRCLLLTSSTSFVDLPFEEHQKMGMHHMDQNPYISSLCPKPRVVWDNTTRGDDVAKSIGPTDPRWGRSAPLLGQPTRICHQWNYTFNMRHVKSVRRGSRVGKLLQPRNLAAWPPKMAGLTSGLPEPHFHPKRWINPPTPPDRKCEFSLQSASKFSSSRVERGEVLRAGGLPGLSGVLKVA